MSFFRLLKSGPVRLLNFPVRSGPVVQFPGPVQCSCYSIGLAAQESIIVPQEPILVPQEPILVVHESILVPQESILLPQESILVPQGSILVRQESSLIDFSLVFLQCFWRATVVGTIRHRRRHRSGTDLAQRAGPLRGGFISPLFHLKNAKVKRY